MNASPRDDAVSLSRQSDGAKTPQQTGTVEVNIHEYQAKGLLRSYGVPVSDGRVVFRAEEAKIRRRRT
jgi:hypothetical protein